MHLVELFLASNVIYFFLSSFSQSVVHSFNKVPQGRESEEVQCIVCSDEPPSIKFEPCGHVIACKGMPR